MDLTLDMTRRQAVLAIGAAAAAACFSDRPEDGTGPGDEGTVIEMTDQLTFSPESVTIPSGGRVTWRNTSDVLHTATGDPARAADPAHASLPPGVAPWDSGGVTAGAEYSRTFDVPGEYRYFCIPHEGVGMLGTIIVTA